MDSYVGKAIFNTRLTDCQISKNTLSLYLDGDTAKNMLWQKSDDGTLSFCHKPLSTNVILVYTNDGRFEIACYFDNENYGINSKSFCMGPTTISIPLKRHIVYDLSKHNDKVYMRYYSKNFHRFSNLIPSFEYKNPENGKAEFYFSCDFPSLDKKCSFKLQKYNVTMKPIYYCSWKGAKIDFIPGIELEFDKRIIDSEIEKIYNSFLRFIHYCFMRTDIFPDRFLFSNGGCEGEIISNFPQDDSIENYTAAWRDSFSWDVLYKHAGELYNLIFDNKIHILNNLENLKQRMSVSFESISKDSAAFESEFDSLFPDGCPCSESRRNLETEIMKELTPLYENSTGKKRKIYKGLIKHVHQETLSNKIKYAFETYKDCISTIKTRLKIDYTNEALGEYCSQIRNDVDHGNRITGITEEQANSFILLRCLIYAMQLKKANFSSEDISNLIDSLYQIKGLL